MTITTANIASLISSVLLLSACQGYQPQPLALSTQAQSLAQQSLDDVAMHTALQARLGDSQWPLKNWTLAQLLVAAVERNPALQQARAELQVAVAAIQTAKAVTNPTLNLGSEYTLAQVDQGSWLWSLSLDWLFESKQRMLRTQLAEVTVQNARLNYAEQLWQVRSELRAAVVLWLVNAQRVQLLSEATQQMEQLLAMQRQRVQLGEAATPEVVPLELQLATLRSDQLATVRQVTLAQTTLAALLNVPTAIIQTMQISWEGWWQVPDMQATAWTTLKEQALLSRADVEQAVREYQQRELELQQATRQRYPQLVLSPGLTWSHGVQAATFGLSMNLPVFNQNQGPIAEAVAKRESAGLAVSAVQATVFHEIESAQVQYTQAVQALQAALEQVDLSEKMVTQTARAAALGGADQLAVLTTSLVRNTQSLLVLDAVEAMQTAVAGMETAVRTPLTGTELQLKRWPLAVDSAVSNTDQARNAASAQPTVNTAKDNP